MASIEVPVTPPANAAVVLTGVIGEINERADTHEWALDALTLNGVLLAETQMTPLYARVAALANVNTTDVRSRLGNLEDTAARRQLAGRIIQCLADAFHDEGTGHPGVTFGSGQTTTPANAAGAASTTNAAAATDAATPSAADEAKTKAAASLREAGLHADADRLEGKTPATSANQADIEAARTEAAASLRAAGLHTEADAMLAASSTPGKSDETARKAAQKEAKAQARKLLADVGITASLKPRTHRKHRRDSSSDSSDTSPSAGSSSSSSDEETKKAKKKARKKKKNAKRRRSRRASSGSDSGSDSDSHGEARMACQKQARKAARQSGNVDLNGFLIVSATPSAHSPCQGSYHAKVGKGHFHIGFAAMMANISTKGHPDHLRQQAPGLQRSSRPAIPGGIAHRRSAMGHFSFNLLAGRGI